MPNNRRYRFPGATLFERVARESRIRTAIHQLEAMDDVLLRDIGVSRSEIARAVRARD